jgi:hypothetical protein
MKKNNEATRKNEGEQPSSDGMSKSGHGHGDGPPTAQTALAFVTRLGLTERELRAAVEAKDVPPAVLGGLARVSVMDIANAFPADVVSALTEPGTTIKLKSGHAERLKECAERARLAASVDEKLSQLATVVDHAARKDANTLDEIVHAVQPQITAQAAVDDTVASQFEALLAYWQQRYPGGGRKGAKSPAQPPAPAPQALK